MRNVRTRILRVGLLAALIVGTVGASAASAAKDPYGVNTYAQYKYCPYENEELSDCFYGRTQGGSEGGEFKYGHVSVKLNQPVIIQGGFKGSGQTIEVSPAANGGQTLESGNETIVHGLNVITTKIQQEAEWPTALKESFAAAKKNKETKATLKIEMVGNECFTVPGCLSTFNLLTESGTAFRLPLKVVISNPWLEKLGGGPCEVGSEEHPIMQHLTSGDAGRAGELSFNEEESSLELRGSELVDVGWHIAPESGANGCGGSEYESYVDKALNMALEVEKPAFDFEGKTGITWLIGNLHDANRSTVVTEGKERGEIP